MIPPSLTDRDAVAFTWFIQILWGVAPAMFLVCAAVRVWLDQRILRRRSSRSPAVPGEP